MAEKCYGRKKLSYVVADRNRSGSRRIEVFVFHENESVRQDLGNSSPSRLLKRCDALARSNISAQKWLAKVMMDYRPYFEKDLVDFTFITFK